MINAQNHTKNTTIRVMEGEGNKTHGPSPRVRPCATYRRIELTGESV